MNLQELTEPVFQYVCRLNRVARKSATIDYETVRTDVTEMLGSMSDKARSDIRLSQQFNKVELPLIFFIDALISESRLHFAMEWNQNRLAFDRQELAGDERFFEMLDETMHERGDDAAERLAVFYTCLGLGFAGWYSGQPDVLKRKMMEIAPRIRSFVEIDESARICPDAYEKTDDRNLVLPPTSKLVPWFIGISVLIVGVGFVYWDSFRSSSKELERSLEQIITQDQGAGRSGN
jgi:type IV/VI secretion system ImpK/VasF family protein